MFQFYIIDTEDPVIVSCPANQVKNTATNLPTTVVVWNDPQANDNSGQAPAVTCSMDSGSQFQIGQTEVVCEARDSSGNQAICTFTIDVIGKFTFSLWARDGIRGRCVFWVCVCVWGVGGGGVCGGVCVWGCVCVCILGVFA